MYNLFRICLLRAISIIIDEQRLLGLVADRFLDVDM
jgi:hypothetical protein